MKKPNLSPELKGIATIPEGIFQIIQSIATFGGKLGLKGSVESDQRLAALQDAAAIESDWQAVGADLYDAMQVVKGDK